MYSCLWLVNPSIVPGQLCMVFNNLITRCPACMRVDGGHLQLYRVFYVLWAHL